MARQVREQSFNQIIGEETLLERLSSIPAVGWIVERGKYIGYFFLLLILSMLMLFQYLSKQTALAEQDFLKAERALSDLNNQERKEAALITLNSLLAKNQELQEIYDGKIAESLLILGDEELAAPFAMRNLNRIASFAPPFGIEYARTSLLLASGKKEEALNEAYLLKESLFKAFGENNPSFPPSLYAFNLIRIAFLEKELQHKEEESKAWSELDLISKGKSRIQLPNLEMNRIMGHFNVEGADLKEFVNK